MPRGKMILFGGKTEDNGWGGRISDFGKRGWYSSNKYM